MNKGFDHGKKMCLHSLSMKTAFVTVKSPINAWNSSNSIILSLKIVSHGVNLDSNLFFQVQLDHLVKVSRVDQENGEHQVCMVSRAEEDILVHQAHRDIVNSVTLPQDILVGQRQNTFNLDDIISRDLKNIMNPLFQFVISPVALSSSHPFNIVFQ